jgi:redox-sensitive bicupin YhaK (pirin superfamily)
LDEFGTDRPEDYIAGFPDHPHRGLETVTYLLEGRMRHRDNHGHEGVPVPGAVQPATEPLYLDVALDAGAGFEVALRAGRF